MARVVQASPKYTESWAAFGMTAEFGTRPETSLYLQWKKHNLSRLHTVPICLATILNWFCKTEVPHSPEESKQITKIGEKLVYSPFSA